MHPSSIINYHLGFGIVQIHFLDLYATDLVIVRLWDKIKLLNYKINHNLYTKTNEA